MPVETLPVHRSSDGCTVAFSSSATATLGALTPRERLDHDRLPTEARRRDWLAGRCAAKQAVAARSGVPVEDIQLEPRVGVAPRCTIRTHDDDWVPLPLSISIAHCDGVAIAAAFDPSTRAGVDIERVGGVQPHQHRYFLSQREHAVDATLLWVLKEAAWKALGLSLGVPFTALELDFAPETSDLRGVRVDGALMTARARVRRLGDMIAALVEIAPEFA
jgi:4'-phosphopantetheinyl transferase EntD